MRRVGFLCLLFWVGGVAGAITYTPPDWGTPSSTSHFYYDNGQSANANGLALRDAVHALTAGHELIIHAGRYEVNGWFHPTINGSDGNPIVVRGADGDLVEIVNSPDRNIMELDGSYVIFRNITFIGGDIGVRIYNAHHIWIDQCIIHDTPGTALTANTYATNNLHITNNEIYDSGVGGGEGEGMYLGGNYGNPVMHSSFIVGNYVHDTGGAQGDGIEVKQGAYGNLIADNVVHSNHYPSILVYGTGGNAQNIIERNICYSSGDNVFQIQGEAIVRNNLAISGGASAFASQYHQGEPTNLQVINNTFINGGTAARLSNWGGKPNMVFANNACYSQSGNAIQLNSSDAGLTFTGNVCVGGVSGLSGGYVMGTSLAADFVNVAYDASSRDAAPSETSSLIGAADPAYLPSEDLHGVARLGSNVAGALAPTVQVTVVSGTDVGRYELFELELLRDDAVYANPFWDVLIEATFTSPGGVEYNCEGFYYDADTWRIRFAPEQEGEWQYAFTMTGASDDFSYSGTFNCVASTQHGPPRVHPDNPERAIHHDGTAWNPMGTNIWTYDNPFLNTVWIPGATTEARWNTYFGEYAAHGCNVYRRLLGVERNVSNPYYMGQIPVWHGSTGTERYDLDLAKVLDKQFSVARAHDIAVLLVFLDKPRDWSQNPLNVVNGGPLATNSAMYDVNDASVLPLFEKYFRYIVNRYAPLTGAWQLFNEFNGGNGLTLEWKQHMAAVVRTYDPYGHFVSNSSTAQAPNDAWQDIRNPHLYYDDWGGPGERDYVPDSDEPQNRGDDGTYCARTIDTWISSYASHRGTPNYFSEFGLGNHLPTDDPNTWQTSLWTAYFMDSGLCFWDDSQQIDFATGFWDRGGINANAYLSDYTRDLMLAHRTITNMIPQTVSYPEQNWDKPTSSDAANLRTYGVWDQSLGFEAVYLHNYTDIAATNSGVSVTVPNLPNDTYVGEWYDPQTAQLVLTEQQSAAPLVFHAPDFSQDIVLLVRPQGGVVFVTQTIPDFTFGQDYLVALNATGGGMPYTWEVVGGQLPTGVTLNETTGVLTGSPVDGNGTSVTIRVTAQDGTMVDQQFTFTVTGAPLTEATLSGTVTDADSGLPVSQVLVSVTRVTSLPTGDPGTPIPVETEMYTDNAGHFQFVFPVDIPGIDRLLFFTRSASHQNKLYDDVAFTGLTPTLGNVSGVTEVDGTGNVSNIDFVLTSTGSKTTYMLPMPDGTKLATDVYLPAGGGSWPVVLYRTPYNKNYDYPPATYTNAGYAVVAQDLRGTSASEGIFRTFRDDGWGPDHQDGYDTCTWIRNQAWCDGDIVTMGGSARGISQNMLAGSLPEGLKAQHVFVGESNLYENMFFQGGAYRQALCDGWIHSRGADAAQYLEEVMKAQPITDDSYWSYFNPETKYDQVNWPIVNRGGWYDIFLQGTINNFTKIQHNGNPGADGNQRLIIGPYGHGFGDGGFVFPSGWESPPALYTSQMLWFDYWVKGVDTGVMDDPAVCYYMMGDVDQPAGGVGNEWRFADDWPVPATEVPFYFHADGSLSTEPPDAATSSTEYVYDPEDPVPTLGGNNLSLTRGPYDQGSLETRDDVLVFTSPVLEEAVEITGKVLVHLYAASSAVDTDFTAKLCDVYPDGRSMLVCDGIVRARFRNGLTAEELLTPGQVYEFEIDLWETAIAFNAGHQIRVSISSSNYPRFDANPNTGEPFNQHTYTTPATQLLYHDASHPSNITLRVTSAVPNFSQPVRILPLGDSITQGGPDGNSIPHDSYRRPLWHMLDDAGYTMDFIGSTTVQWTGEESYSVLDFDLDHEGHAGWRADQILASLPGWLTEYTPDIALVHLGTNDLGQGQDVPSTITELGQIIDELRNDNPDVTILMAQIIPVTAGWPDFNNAAAVLNAEIANLAALKDTAQSPVLVVNQNLGFDGDLDNFDGIHPNNAGEQKMATKWFAALAPILTPAGQPHIVVFPDANLEAGVRAAINKPSGDIYTTDLVGTGFTNLNVNASGILDLTGLEYCTDLTALDLSGNQISDVSALASLTNLETLTLDGNPVSDYTPLAGLINLTTLFMRSMQIDDIGFVTFLTALDQLNLWDNDIADLGPMSTLTNLRILNVGRNQVSNISALASLVNLQELSLEENQFSSISALSGLTLLTKLYLDNNQISEIDALLANPAVYQLLLANNPLTERALCVDLPILLERGVTVDIEPCNGIADPVIAIGEHLTLENADVAYDFVRDDTGLVPSSFAVAGSQVSFPLLERGLWNVIAKKPDDTEVLVSPDGLFDLDVSVQNNAQVITMTWPYVPVDQDNALEVVVTVTLPDASDTATWHIDTRWSLGGDYATYAVEFPILHLGYAGAPENARLALSASSGNLLTDPIARFDELEATFNIEIEHEKTYTGVQSMQFTTLYDTESRNAVYVAVNDSQAHYKHFATKSEGGALRHKIIHYPADNRTPGQDFSVPYDAEIALYEALSPDAWYDAAKRYRDWAVQQPWCARGPWETSPDVSDVLRRQNVWFLMSPINDDANAFPFFSDVLSMWQDALGIPEAIALWYRWERGGFNLHTPDNFPIRDQFVPGVDLAHARDQFVYPYVNPLVYSTLADDYVSLDVEGTMSVIDEAGMPKMMNLGAYPDVEATFPCQASLLWRDRFNAMIQQLIDDADIDGAYFDFWSGLDAQLCFATNHGHLPGGGNYYSLGKRAFGQYIRDEARKKKPDFFMTSESIDETLIGVLDMAHEIPLHDSRNFGGWAKEVHVPMFSTVYHEYINASGFGLFPADIPTEDPEGPWLYTMFRVMGMHGGEMLSIPNWFSEQANLVDQESPTEVELVDFMRRDVAFMEAAAPYVKFGRRMRPLNVTNVDTMYFQPPTGFLVAESYDVPKVYASVWRASNGNLGLVFGNWTRDPQDISYEFDPALYEWYPGAGYTVNAPEGSSLEAGARQVTRTIPAESYVLVELVPASVSLMPDLRNLGYTAARDTLQNYGFIQGIVTNAYSTSMPAGRVISHTPVAGTLVSTGTAVDMVVSLGPPAALSGRVQDAQTGDPIVGARTAVLGFGHAMTDVNGEYALSDIPPGTYRILISADGFDALSTELQLPGGLTTVGNFSLSALPVVEGEGEGEGNLPPAEGEGEGEGSLPPTEGEGEGSLPPTEGEGEGEGDVILYNGMTLEELILASDVDDIPGVSATDIQKVINGVLYHGSCSSCDISGDGATDATDVQLVIVAVLKSV